MAECLLPVSPAPDQKICYQAILPIQSFTLKPGQPTPQQDIGNGLNVGMAGQPRILVLQKPVEGERDCWFREQEGEDLSSKGIETCRIFLHYHMEDYIVVWTIQVMAVFHPVRASFMYFHIASPDQIPNNNFGIEEIWPGIDVLMAGG